MKSLSITNYLPFTLLPTLVPPALVITILLSVYISLSSLFCLIPSYQLGASYQAPNSDSYHRVLCIHKSVSNFFILFIRFYI